MAVGKPDEPGRGFGVGQILVGQAGEGVGKGGGARAVGQGVVVGGALLLFGLEYLLWSLMIVGVGVPILSAKPCQRAVPLLT